MKWREKIKQMRKDIEIYKFLMRADVKKLRQAENDAGNIYWGALNTCKGLIEAKQAEGLEGVNPINKTASIACTLAYGLYQLNGIESKAIVMITCLEGIIGVSTLPQFTEEVHKKLLSQVCEIAKKQINGEIATVNI